MRFYSRVEDPTNALQMFSQEDRSTLREKGLLKLDPLQTYQMPLQARVISTDRLPRDPAMSKHQKWPLKQRFDATDIHRKYKEVVLMKDVQLQELHISEIGLKKVLYENVVVAGYRNIASVPLPGIAADGTDQLQTELDARIRVRSPE